MKKKKMMMKNEIVYTNYTKKMKDQNNYELNVKLPYINIKNENSTRL